MANKKKIASMRRVNIKNRRAWFDYAFEERFKAGMVLTGTEIKSIRAGKASLSESYCFVHEGEVWVKNMYVAAYDFGSYGNHAVRRDRKLLLTRKEIRHLEQALKAPGLTLIPLLLFIDDKGLAKLDVALARGKKQFDKRQAIREREDRRETDRYVKRF